MTDSDAVDGVHIVCSAGEVVVARVRDDGGIHAVTRGSASAWSCSCADEACHHIAAVRQTTEVVA